MKQVSLADWLDFENSLRAELTALEYTGKVVARSFALTTFNADHTEIDRLAMVINTGTDRSPDSPFWNEPGFDHDHDGDPRGERTGAASSSGLEQGQTGRPEDAIKVEEDMGDPNSPTAD